MPLRQRTMLLRNDLDEQVITPDTGLELRSVNRGPLIAYIHGVRCSPGTRVVMVEMDELGGETVVSAFTQPEDERQLR